MKPTIKKVLEGVNMGLGHKGLSELLKKQAKVDVSKLDGADLIMCINQRGDKMKVIGAKGLVIGYLRMPHGQRIMKDALQFIPRTFGAAGFDYDAACRTALKYRLENSRWTGARVSPLKAAAEARAAGV